MTNDIRELIAAKPFEPFTIHTAAGRAFPVPTVDHIAMPPTGGRIFVFRDDEGDDVLSPLLVVRLSVERGEPTPRTGT